MNKTQLIEAIILLGCKDNLKALNKAELEQLLTVWQAKDTGPVIKAITPEALQIALDKEVILAGAITDAKAAMRDHYLTVLTPTGILKDNGLPSTSGKLLVKMFHDYPLSEDNNPVGLEVAKKTHAGAQFIKRAYMCLNWHKVQTEQAAMSPEELETKKAKKAGKGTSKDAGGAQPETISKELVLAYLARNEKVAFNFALAHIANESKEAENALICADLTEVLETYLIQVGIN